MIWDLGVICFRFWVIDKFSSLRLWGFGGGKEKFLVVRFLG